VKSNAPERPGGLVAAQKFVPGFWANAVRPSNRLVMSLRAAPLAHESCRVACSVEWLFRDSGQRVNRVPFDKNSPDNGPSNAAGEALDVPPRLVEARSQVPDSFGEPHIDRGRLVLTSHGSPCGEGNGATKTAATTGRSDFILNSNC